MNLDHILLQLATERDRIQEAINLLRGGEQPEPVLDKSEAYRRSVAETDRLRSELGQEADQFWAGPGKQMVDNAKRAIAPPASAKRGRRSFTAAQRRAQSERMKASWAKRHAKAKRSGKK